MPHKITLSNIRRRNYMKEYIEFQRKITKGGGTSTSYRITIPEEIINKTDEKYREWYSRLTGKEI